MRIYFSIALLAAGIITECIFIFYKVDELGIDYLRTVGKWWGFHDYEDFLTWLIALAISGSCFFGAKELAGISFIHESNIDYIIPYVIAIAIPIVTLHTLGIKGRKIQAEKKFMEKALEIKEKEIKMKHYNELQKTKADIIKSSKYFALTSFIEHNINNIYSVDLYGTVTYASTYNIFVKDYKSQSWILNVNNSYIYKSFFTIEQDERAWTSVELMAINQLISEYMQNQPLFLFINDTFIRQPPTTRIEGKRPY